MDFFTELWMGNTDPAQQADILRTLLKEHCVVHLKPRHYLSDLRGFYDRLTTAVGGAVNIGEDFANGGVQTGERWMEIRYDADIPDHVAYRHSRNAQPLHTDESYIRDPADTMFFYCVNQAISGGATTFIHGPQLVDVLASRDPQLLADLLNSEVSYAKGDESRTRPIIRRDELGRIELNFNYHCVNPDETEQNKRLNQRFHEFLQTHIVASSHLREVLLQPGEAVAWWDSRVLHGRTCFVADKTNDRFIWKTGKANRLSNNFHGFMG